MSNFRTLLASFAIFSVSVWGLAFAADWIHPRLPCMDAETKYWEGRPQVYRFERVSSYFWSSLCREPARPLIISASEGTGSLSFPQEAFKYFISANEFTGAHRGLKTLAYMLASNPHPDRVKRMRILAFINPVYFSFAARTDASSVSLTAISNLSYVARISSFHQKWDEFLLASPFIGAKSYFEELLLFRDGLPSELQWYRPDATKPARGEYDFDRNMMKELTHEYTSFRSKFSARVQPARYLFDQVVKFARAHPEADICYVMLPVNVKNLRHFDRDTEKIERDMRTLMFGLPEKSQVNLESLNEEPFIFKDPMHLTDWGKRRVLEKVLQSECGEKVFGKVAL